MKTTVLLRDPVLDDEDLEFNGPVTEILQYLAPIEGMFTYTTTEKNKSIVIRLSPLARTLRADPSALFGEVKSRVFCQEAINDPRIIELSDGRMAITTENDGATYRYTGMIDGAPIWGFTVNSRQSVETARAYLTEAISVGTLLENFMGSVQNDFPNAAVPEQVFQPVDEFPVDAPVPPTDQPLARKPVEALPRSPSLTALMGKKPTGTKTPSSVHLMICKPGGPWIDVEIISPAAGMIKSTGFLETLNGYLKDKGTLLPMDKGFHIAMVNPEAAGEFDQIIRSALHDHNALEGATIEHHEFNESTFDPALFI